jgi:UDP-N-acetyl-2-amino-2-deoxyglucuronate dehydrogenase
MGAAMSFVSRDHSPWNLDPLQELEQESGKRIFTILQVRLHPRPMHLREDLRREATGRQHEVLLTYVTARGAWYHVSWKGSIEKSGGIAANIGIHLFDLLLWLFGKVGDSRVYAADPRRMCGFLELERARVKWFLSVDPADLPFEAKPGELATHRSIRQHHDRDRAGHWSSNQTLAKRGAVLS